MPTCVGMTIKGSRARSQLTTSRLPTDDITIADCLRPTTELLPHRCDVSEMLLVVAGEAQDQV